MKKWVIPLVCAVLLISTITLTASAAVSSVHYENAIYENSSFCILNSNANIEESYVTYPNAQIEQVTIHTVLKKRTALFFWNTIVEWTYERYTSADSILLVYPVDSGRYKVTIHYEVRFVDGTVDEIDKVHEASN